MVLFTDQIISNYPWAKLAGLVTQLKLLLYLIPAEHFQPAADDPDLEQWCEALDVPDHVRENLNFVFERNWAVLVKQTAENVANLNNRNVFFDVFFQTSIKDLNKKLLVVVEFISERKLVLKTLPNFMVLAVGNMRTKSHFLLQVIVKLCGIFRVLSKNVYVDVTILFEVWITAYFKVVFLGRVVHAVIISKLE